MLGTFGEIGFLHRVIGQVVQLKTIAIDAMDLDAGEYEADIHFLSNDPNDENAAVNVVLQIAEAPVLAIEPDPVDFGGVDVASEGDVTFTISNSGNTDLVISDVSVEGEVFTTNFENELSIERRGSVELTGTFAPEEDGEHNGTLLITSNDHFNEVTEIELIGIGLDPPIITIDPDAIETDETSDHPVTLANIGDYDLEWTSDLEIIAEPGQDLARRHVRGTDGVGPSRDDAGDLLGQFQGINVEGHYSSCIGWDSGNERMWVTNYNNNIAAA